MYATYGEQGVGFRVQGVGSRVPTSRPVAVCIYNRPILA